jgi:hypothetical protein
MIADFREGFEISSPFPGAMRCYCVQIIEIVVEDAVQECWRRNGRFRRGGEFQGFKRR